MWNFIIKFTLYGIAVTGLWVIVRPLMDLSIKNVAKRMDYRMRLKAKFFGEKTKNLNHRFIFYRHIDNLLYIVEKNYEPGTSSVRFYIKTVLLFLGVFVISFATIGELPNHISFDNPFIDGIRMERIGSSPAWQFPFIFSLMIATIPYLRLRYRYSLRRVKASYDLLEVVQIFTKYCHLSIDSALAYTADTLSAGNVLRQPIRILSESFSTYGSEQELREEINRFNETVDTTFSMQFTSDLLYAEREGNHFLRESLMKLKDDMEFQRGSILEVRSNSRDAIQMGIWGNFLVMILCCGSMAAFVTPHVYFRLQFQTKAGLIFITLILILFFISFMISHTLSRPKLDYK